MLSTGSEILGFIQVRDTSFRCSQLGTIRSACGSTTTLLPSSVKAVAEMWRNKKASETTFL